MRVGCYFKIVIKVSLREREREREREGDSERERNMIEKLRLISLFKGISTIVGYYDRMPEVGFNPMLRR